MISFFNRIFRSNSIPKISNIGSQNYKKYKKTYDTLSKIFGKLDGVNAYLVGGISAAIQCNQDLYRQNDDIDIMCKEEDLPKLIETLQEAGYVIDDRRGIKTRNRVNSDGHFQARDHELNADTKNRKMLGIGIFTYQIKGNEVVTHSYAFEEREGKVVETEKFLPKELFDLMYDSTTINYKGLKLKTQSKEYIYMTKSSGTREKDNLDASIVKPYLNDESSKKIQEIRKLNAKTRAYRIVYDENGKISSKTKQPSLEEKVFHYLDSRLTEGSAKNPEDVLEQLLKDENYKRISSVHPEIEDLIESWKKTTYTHHDKDEFRPKESFTPQGRLNKKKYRAKRLALFLDKEDFVMKDNNSLAHSKWIIL